MTHDQAGTAATFRDLHRRGEPLILPNAWDAGSARLMAHIGCEAVATTSAGVAWAHGYPDGGALPIGLLSATVRSIARVARVPVSVDIEGGYADDPDQVGATVAAVIEAGAVGINIEDGAGPPELLCRKIEASRRAADRAGIALFINARTDVYLRGLVPGGRRTAEVIRRAGLYRASGADGLFVPLVAEPGAVRAIGANAGLPLNVMACPGLPPSPELGRLGVRRLSAGSAIAQGVFARMSELGAGFLRHGGSDTLTDGAMPFPDINALFA